MILKCIKVVAVAVFALVSLNVSGQDLLARQAPIDKKLKAIDSVALIRQIKKEMAAYPAFGLYPDWNNTRVHAFGNAVVVPDTFRIDMTGFAMPTTNTKITSKFGPRRRRMHNGIDVKVYIGDTIRAAFSGKVRMVKYERRGYGRLARRQGRQFSERHPRPWSGVELGGSRYRLPLYAHAWTRKPRARYRARSFAAQLSAAQSDHAPRRGRNVHVG